MQQKVIPILILTALLVIYSFLEAAGKSPVYDNIFLQQVTGTVIDEKNQPVAGVSIMVKNSKKRGNI